MDREIGNHLTAIANFRDRNQLCTCIGLTYFRGN
jgi:hypothetical protein